MNYRHALGAAAAFAAGITVTLAVLHSGAEPERNVGTDREEAKARSTFTPWSSRPQAHKRARNARDEPMRRSSPIDVNPRIDEFKEIAPTPRRSPRPTREFAHTDFERPLSHAELAERAERIQRTSERRLAKLAVDLNLTDAQQDQIFGILARSSPAYHPSLKVGVVDTETGTADEIDNISSNTEESDAISRRVSPFEVEDKIAATLDEHQAERLAVETLERDRWWTDIVNELEADFDRSVRNEAENPSQDPPPVEPSPIVPDTPVKAGETAPQSHRGGNLFDLIGGER